MKRTLGGVVDFEAEEKSAAVFEIRLLILVALSVFVTLGVWSAKGYADSYSASCKTYGQWDTQCTGEHGKLRGKHER